MLRHFAPRSGTRNSFPRPGSLPEFCQPTVRTHKSPKSEGKPKFRRLEGYLMFWVFLWPAKKIWCTNSEYYLLCKRSEILQIFWLVAQVVNNLGRKKWILGDKEKDMHRPKEMEKDLLRRSRFDSGKIYCLRGRFLDLCKCRMDCATRTNRDMHAQTDLKWIFEDIGGRYEFEYK